MLFLIKIIIKLAIIFIFAVAGSFVVFAAIGSGGMNADFKTVFIIMFVIGAVFIMSRKAE
jgi:hypothetical protein